MGNKEVLNERYKELLNVLVNRKEKVVSNTKKLFYSITDALKLYQDLSHDNGLLTINFAYSYTDKKVYCNLLGTIINDYYTSPEDIDLELLKLLCEEEGITFNYKELPDACIYMFDKVLDRKMQIMDLYELILSNLDSQVSGTDFKEYSFTVDLKNRVIYSSDRKDLISRYTLKVLNIDLRELNDICTRNGIVMNVDMTGDLVHYKFFKTNILER